MTISQLQDVQNVDPTAKHSAVVNSAIANFRKQELLSISTARKLILDEVRTPQLHVLPKAHKPNIPGRPVVSLIECHTSKILKFVDHSSYTPNYSLHI